MTKLKPCPWCGDEPLTEIQNKYLIIECSTLGCLGPTVSSMNHKKLIADWNRRPVDVK